MSKTNFSEYSIISNNAQLTENICKYLRKNGEYLPVFDFIKGKISESNSVYFGDFSNHCVKTYNMTQHLQSKKVIVAGCGNKINVEFQKHVPSEKLILIKNDAEELFKYIKKPKNKIEIKIEIKIESKLPSNFSDTNLIYIEHSDNELADIIAKNLAYFTNAVIVRLNKVTREETEELEEMFKYWMNSEDSLQRDCRKTLILKNYKNCDLQIWFISTDLG